MIRVVVFRRVNTTSVSECMLCLHSIAVIKPPPPFLVYGHERALVDRLVHSRYRVSITLASCDVNTHAAILTREGREIEDSRGEERDSDDG